MPKKRRVAPLNRRFLGGVCVPRESERDRERGERALINNNTGLRSRFYWIQLFTASSVKKRLPGLCLCYFFPTFCRLSFTHSLLNAIAEVRSFFDTTQSLGCADI
ncbi:hypothetical protein EPR50_G00198990 [Perca flavescens]|uniref:Uncharacterized protein n=1 Tax=Perca flavescens TaxID=8167 RepID=A0A484CDL7_PERFV|nr:hypothetical protein EPR50_G00198990 [Perca flavescens]